MEPVDGTCFGARRRFLSEVEFPSFIHVQRVNGKRVHGYRLLRLPPRFFTVSGWDSGIIKFVWCLWHFRGWQSIAAGVEVFKRPHESSATRFFANQEPPAE